MWWTHRHTRTRKLAYVSQVTGPSVSAGKWKKRPRNPCGKVNKLRDPEPGGGNPPLNSNVITGAFALDCCEEFSKDAAAELDKLYDLFKEFRDRAKQQFDYLGEEDRVIEILFGNPFDKAKLSYEAALTLPNEIEKGFPKVNTYTQRVPGAGTGFRFGTIAVVIPGIQYLYTLYNTREQEVLSDTLTQTMEILNLIKTRKKTKKKLRTCLDCIKEKLLRQSRHKEITIEKQS